MTFKKLAAYLIALVAIAVFTVSILGITKKYGDITTNIVNPASNLNVEVDYSSASAFVLAAPEELTVAQMKEAQQVLFKRLESLGFVDYNSWCDYEQREILVEFANTYYTYNSLNWLVNNMGAEGVVYGQHGSEDTSDQSQWIFDSTQIRKSKITYDQNTFQFTVEISLNSKGKAQLKEKTTELLEASTEGVNVYLSLWSNGSSIGTAEISDPIKNGVIVFKSSYDMQSNLNDASIYLNSGPLPAEFTIASLSLNDPLLGDNAVNNIGLGLACGLLAAFIYLIFRFGLGGLSASICTLGSIGIMIFFITGFMAGVAMTVSLSALAAAAVSILLCLGCAIRDGQAIKENLKDNALDRSVQVAFKATFSKSTIIYAIAAVLAVVMILCGKNDILVQLMKNIGQQSTMIYAIGSFGSVLLIGVLAGFVFNILLHRIVVKSLTQAFRKPTLFGGVRHEG